MISVACESEEGSLYLLGSEVTGWFQSLPDLYTQFVTSVPLRKICISKNLPLQSISQGNFALLHLKVISNFFGSSIGKLSALSMIVLEILHGDFYLALNMYK